MKNLIYMCVFVNPNYVNLLRLLLTSIKLYAKVDFTTTDILIFTDETLKPSIEQIAVELDLPLKYTILKINTKWEAACSRLQIFQSEHIHNYDKILYLDTDILLHKDVNTIFNFDLREDKLYAMSEGQLGSYYWGAQFFNFPQRQQLSSWCDSKIDEYSPGFCSGVLLFRNTLSMRDLFTKINDHIFQHIIVEKKPIPDYWDQPFIVFQAINENKCDNTLLNKYVVNNKYFVQENECIIYHFPCGPGWYELKIEKMSQFAEAQKLYYNPEALPTLMGKGEKIADNWLNFVEPTRLRPINYLEIGVFCGHNLITVERLYGRHPDSRMYGIDPWDLQNPEYKEALDNQTYNYEACLTNIKSSRTPEKFIVHKGFSHMYVPRFQDNFFDIVYIDANHETYNVVEDAIQSFRKLRSGGYMIFADCYWKNVEKAIDIFCKLAGNKLSWVGISHQQNFFKKN